MHSLTSRPPSSTRDSATLDRSRSATAPGLVRTSSSDPAFPSAAARSSGRTPSCCRTCQTTPSPSALLRGSYGTSPKRPRPRSPREQRSAHLLLLPPYRGSRGSASAEIRAVLARSGPHRDRAHRLGPYGRTLDTTRHHALVGHSA